MIDYLAERCSSCGADIAAELEIAAFHQPAVDSARRMILWAGATYPLMPLLFFVMLARYTGASVFASSAFLVSMGVGLALLGGHVGLWLWARRAALPAMSTALALFVGNLALTGLRDGWLVKTVTFVILSRGLLAAFRAHRLRAGLAALRS